MSLISKKNGKERIKNAVKPKRFYVELAEEGILEDFLKNYMNDSYISDKQFREEMLEILYNYSSEPVKDIENLLMEQLCESLEYFLEYIRSYMSFYD